MDETAIAKRGRVSAEMLAEARRLLGMSPVASPNAWWDKADQWCERYDSGGFAQGETLTTGPDPVAVRTEVLGKLGLALSPSRYTTGDEVAAEIAAVAGPLAGWAMTGELPGNPLRKLADYMHWAHPGLMLERGEPVSAVIVLLDWYRDQATALAGQLDRPELAEALQGVYRVDAPANIFGTAAAVLARLADDLARNDTAPEPEPADDDVRPAPDDDAPDWA